MKPYRDDVLELVFEGGIATITLDRRDGVNRLDALAVGALRDALDRLEKEDDWRGTILRSVERAFCVGADLTWLLQPHRPGTLLAASEALGALLARLEAGPPAVAVLGGSALGGGYELALACNRRFAIDDPSLQVGLPETRLGLIPGGGGTQRLPRLIGIQQATEAILSGQTLRAPAALRAGWVDGLYPDAARATAAAKAWIEAHPHAKQAWQEPGFRWKGVQPGTTEARDLFLVASAQLYARTAGAFPAQNTALSVIHRGVHTAMERAGAIEARAFAHLASQPSTRAMVRTLFFHKNACDNGEGLTVAERSDLRKIAIVGAGQMGAGIAWVCAKAGFEVVLEDVDPQALERARAHVERQAARLRHLDPAQRSAIVERVHTTLDREPLRGADLLIEAVYEDRASKQRVFDEVDALLAEDAIIASNTSALPITELAQGRERFIGLHFFSPVEKMPLVEIVKGERTSSATVARCTRFVMELSKTPIVVNDGYGFYTTRVFSAYILEGAQMVAEGFPAAAVEWAARSAGMVVGPLQVFDEVSLRLGVHAMEQARAYRPGIDDLPGVALVRELVALGRTGRSVGAGFYDYVEGRRSGIWIDLNTLVTAGPRTVDLRAMGERLLLAQVAEVGRALDDGIVVHRRDADVGAIFGIGFAPQTGGPLAYADQMGLPALVERLHALERAHGDRFAPARVFREMAESGSRFFD